MAAVEHIVIADRRLAVLQRAAARYWRDAQLMDPGGLSQVCSESTTCRAAVMNEILYYEWRVGADPRDDRIALAVAAEMPAPFRLRRPARALAIGIDGSAVAAFSRSTLRHGVVLSERQPLDIHFHGGSGVDRLLWRSHALNIGRSEVVLANVSPLADHSGRFVSDAMEIRTRTGWWLPVYTRQSRQTDVSRRVFPAAPVVGSCEDTELVVACLLAFVASVETWGLLGEPCVGD